MNLRFSEQELRFRVSKSELELLCEGSDLKQCTYLPNGKSLKYIIKADSYRESMFLEYEDNQIILHANINYIKEFYDSLPRRDGLETTQTLSKNREIILILEVDIRTHKRKRG